MICVVKHRTSKKYKCHCFGMNYDLIILINRLVRERESVGRKISRAFMRLRVIQYFVWRNRMKFRIIINIYSKLLYSLPFDEPEMLSNGRPKPLRSYFHSVSVGLAVRYLASSRNINQYTKFNLLIFSSFIVTIFSRLSSYLPALLCRSSIHSFIHLS